MFGLLFLVKTCDFMVLEFSKMLEDQKPQILGSKHAKMSFRAGQTNYLTEFRIY